MKLKRMKGCAAKEVPSYINKFMWWERFGKTSWEAMNYGIREISQQYPVRLFSAFITGFFFQSHHTFKKIALQIYRRKTVAPGISYGIYTMTRIRLDNNSHPPNPSVEAISA